MEYFITATLSDKVERLKRNTDGDTDTTVPESGDPSTYTTQESFTYQGHVMEAELHPGDTLSVLRPTQVTTKHVSVCLFHTSPVGGTKGTPR